MEVEMQDFIKYLKSDEKICSDYDDECCDVPNPAECFLGGTCCPPKGVDKLGITDGICPEMYRGKQ